MGANTSSLVSEDIEEMARESNLSPREIKRLYKRFQKLDRNQSGSLEADELTMIPELAMNPLFPRIVQIFESVNFREFVKLLSVFSESASEEAKRDFVFRFFDIDQDGFVSSTDLIEILLMLCGSNLTQGELEEISQLIIRDADMDKDGMVSYDDFCACDSLGTISQLCQISLA
ncbi:Calcineurin subunit B [Porphyridium purpureum]|uniref:Calcineurin subunit B n=1 Tax=Porphyridium purpureum TaxID=35688 RepID=A0A5J4YMN2_PORPP|nr:Calcineurin subunit B [Porphyridium purpureum]|eukprot:POR0653..scf244_11